MTNKAAIKEIFTSIQGEGPFIGYKQLFIRFCGCNLSCAYCDTNHNSKDAKIYTPLELIALANSQTDCHSVALTGGEPLLHTAFLKEFLSQCPLPVYLETNATLAGELSEVIDLIDYISADIKLSSCTNEIERWETHDRFFDVAKPKKLFAKIVFDENITDNEISSACALGAKHRIELILQPKMTKDGLSISNTFIESILDKFLTKYKKVRLIPQVHKFLDLR